MGYPKTGRESQKNLKWTFENWGARVERDRIKMAAEGEFRATRPRLALNIGVKPHLHHGHVGTALASGKRKRGFPG